MHSDQNIHLLPDGSVGVGTTSPGADYKLDITGSMRTTKGFYTDDTVSVGTGNYGDNATIGFSWGTWLTKTAGTIYYFGSAGIWASQAQAITGSTGYNGLLGIVTSEGSTKNMVLNGLVQLANNPGGSIGDVVYLSDSSAGQATTTIPSSNGDVVRVIGHVVNSTNGVIYFNPSNDWVVVTA